MLLEQRTAVLDDLRAEPQRQQSQDHEPDKSSREDGEEKVRELHFKDRCRQHEQLERHGRRQHSGKHQRPEFMALEGLMNLLEAFFRNTLPQNFLAAEIADKIERNAAERRAQRRHHHVEEKPAPVLKHIGRDDRVDGHAEQSGINPRDGEDAPDAERLEQCPNPRCIARKKMSDRLQANKFTGKTRSAVDERRAIFSRFRRNVECCR